MLPLFKDESGEPLGTEQDLVLFVDETGHECFRDPAHPVFGYGGCAVMAADYHRIIHEPWQRLKAQWLGNATLPLHAADFRASTAQAKALAAFFHQPFARFAAVMKASTKNASSLSAYDVTSACLMRRARDLAAWYPAGRLVFVFESSQRLDPFSARFFGKVHFHVENDGTTTELPVRWCRMPKSAVEPGLELADFVIHTAGAQVRKHEKQGTAGYRLDFRAVFQDVDHRLASYMEIDSVQQGERDGTSSK